MLPAAGPILVHHLLHPEIEVLSMSWEAGIKCIVFWHRILTDYGIRSFDTQLFWPIQHWRPHAGRDQWIGRMRDVLKFLVGSTTAVPLWLGYLEGGHLRELMRSVARRCMEMD